MRRALAAMALLAWLAFPALATSADGASYLDESIQALQSGKVYISQLAQLDPSAKDQLEQKIGNSDIAVAVLPAEAAKETGGNVYAFVNGIAQATGHHTVVVVVGNDFEAGSDVLQAGLAKQYANQAENSGSVEDGLSKFIGEVKAYRSQPSTPHTGNNSGGGVPVFILLVAVAVIAAGGLFGAKFYRQSRSSQLEHVELDKSPEQVKNQLKKLLALRSQVVDSELQSAITNICRDAEEYFSRAQQRKAELTSEAAVFAGNLRDTEQVLSKYLEIQGNPRYYPNARTDMDSGKQSILKYADFVLNSAQQATNEGMTDYKVNVDILAAKQYAITSGKE